MPKNVGWPCSLTQNGDFEWPCHMAQRFAVRLNREDAENRPELARSRESQGKPFNTDSVYVPTAFSSTQQNSFRLGIHGGTLLARAALFHLPRATFLFFLQPYCTVKEARTKNTAQSAKRAALGQLGLSLIPEIFSAISEWHQNNEVENMWLAAFIVPSLASISQSECEHHYRWERGY